MQQELYNYILMLGDNSLVLGHRLSELCGKGPSLETDIALTNHSLDLFGQVRNYYQYAAELSDKDITEDDIAFLRYEHEYKNVLLVEQPNKDFAYVIARQFFYDAYHLLLLEGLKESKDEHLAAIAIKSLKEVKYHFRFSSEWVKRLGDGTEVSKQKMQAAIDYLWPYVGELFEESPLEKQMKEAGIGVDLAHVQHAYENTVAEVIRLAGLEHPTAKWSKNGGKKGIHSEHLGYILAQLQYMQRAYPNMKW